MKICLQFIMLNESAVVKRMLHSVMPIIDMAVCVDTGSTDNCKQIVKDFFEECGKPCYIYDFPKQEQDSGFLMFNDWRNYALEKAKGLADYNMWLDCDEQFIMPKGYELNEVNKVKKELAKGGCGHVQAQSGSMKWSRTNFFKSSFPYKWISCVHECLISDIYAEPVVIDEKLAYIKVTPDGNSWTSESEEKKYSRHAESFMHYIDKNGLEPRAVFYLAQSWRDANTEESKLLAIDWWRERIAITTGFNEERYISQLRIGKMYETLNKSFAETLEEYLKCEELDTERAEHLVDIIRLCQKHDQWNTAYLFSSYAMKFHGKSPYPKTRFLFVDNDLYNIEIVDLHKINCSRLNKMHEVAPYINTEETYNNLCNTISDINEHLPILRKYASKCSIVTEINARWNVHSTYAFIASKPRFLNSWDYYFLNDFATLDVYAKKNGIKFKSIVGSDISKPVDLTGLLFLDSIHDYDHVLNELKLHSPNVTKYIVIHDTIVFGKENSNDKASPRQGIQGAIEEFLELDKEWNMVECLENNNGLVVLERGKWGENRRIKF